MEDKKLIERIEQLARQELEIYSRLLKSVEELLGPAAVIHYKRHLIQFFTLGYLKAYNEFYKKERTKAS